MRLKIERNLRLVNGSCAADLGVANSAPIGDGHTTREPFSARSLEPVVGVLLRLAADFLMEVFHLFLVALVEAKAADDDVARRAVGHENARVALGWDRLPVGRAAVGIIPLVGHATRWSDFGEIMRPARDNGESLAPEVVDRLR